MVVRAKSPDASAWLHAFAEGVAHMRDGAYFQAGAAYERALAGFAEELAALSEAGRRARREDPEIARAAKHARYELACVHSLASVGRDGPGAAPQSIDPAEACRRRDRAFAELERCLEAGSLDPIHLSHDSDLVSLRDDPRWASLLARVRAAANPK